MDIDAIFTRLAAIESGDGDDDTRFLATISTRLLKCVLTDSQKMSILCGESSDLQHELASLKTAIRKLGGEV